MEPVVDTSDLIWAIKELLDMLEDEHTGMYEWALDYLSEKMEIDFRKLLEV